MASYTLADRGGQGLFGMGIDLLVLGDIVLEK